MMDQKIALVKAFLAYKKAEYKIARAKHLRFKTFGDGNFGGDPEQLAYLHSELHKMTNRLGELGQSFKGSPLGDAQQWLTKNSDVVLSTIQQKNRAFDQDIANYEAIKSEAAVKLHSAYESYLQLNPDNRRCVVGLANNDDKFSASTFARASALFTPERPIYQALKESMTDFERRVLTFPGFPLFACSKEDVNEVHKIIFTTIGNILDNNSLHHISLMTEEMKPADALIFEEGIYPNWFSMKPHEELAYPILEGDALRMVDLKRTEDFGFRPEHWSSEGIA